MGDIVSKVMDSVCDCFGYKRKENKLNNIVKQIEELGTEEYNKLIKYYQHNRGNMCCCY